MPDNIIIVDTNVLIDISRGNQSAADALNRFRQQGCTVYIARAAHDELVTRAATPYLGGHYREMLKDLRIEIAPSGPADARHNLYADNIQHNPAPNQPGQIKEYDRKNDPTKPGDAFVAAQAKALNAKLWTFDADLRKRAPQFGVRLADECSIGGKSGPEDPVLGRRILGLQPKNIGANGQIIPPPPPGGGGGKTGSYQIHPDMNVPGLVTPNPRGQAKIAGIQLAFEGLNFALNRVNDILQKKKVDEALAQIRPQIAQARQESPQSGVVLMFYFRQFESDPNSVVKAGPEFDFVDWAQGSSQDEAVRNFKSKGAIGPGALNDQRLFSEQVWLPPLQQSLITVAKSPFPPIAIGQFFLGNSNHAKFQNVSFDCFGGFDDVDEKSVELAANTNIQFAVLRPPTQVVWFNVNGRQTTDVPLKEGTTANNNTIKVVDLDPWTPFNAKAAMVFPVNASTEKIFNLQLPTGGYQNLVLGQVNFGMVRWIRPENIHLLRFL